MIDPALEAEYNNRAKVPGHPAVIASWVRDAAAFRSAAPHAALDIAYGASKRQVMDIFTPERGTTGAVALFIHGGYWQSLDKSFASHLASGLLAHGVTVAVPSYDLCPQVTVEVIAGQMQSAARFLTTRFGRLDLAIGHSAGGHLAAMLLADELVPAALAISGLFDLRPLVKTTVNGALGLDEAQAWRLSPRNRPQPTGAFHAVVGGREGREYAAQSRAMAEVWGGRCDVLPEHDHFTIVGELARGDSPMVAACRQMLAGTRKHEGGQ